MATFGFTLMGEMFGPKELVRNSVLAEQAGFDFAVYSDHFHPWLFSHDNSPFVWSVLGAAAERTERIGLMTMVTCPFLRYHPAIIAQSAATVAVMSDGRFTLGLGAGEILNEHIVAKGWPPAHVRHAMLEESVQAIRQLWTGEPTTFDGRYIQVEDAILYTRPQTPPPIAIAAGGAEAAKLAARAADALIATEPEPSYVQTFHANGGQGKPTYNQIPLSWHPDEGTARKLALERFRFGVSGWKVQAELPMPVNFEAATKTVREEDVAEMVPCGPDPEVHVAGIKKFLDAGYDRIAVVQVGPDQEGFLQFWQSELAPRLAHV